MNKQIDNNPFTEYQKLDLASCKNCKYCRPVEGVYGCNHPEIEAVIWSGKIENIAEEFSKWSERNNFRIFEELLPEDANEPGKHLAKSVCDLYEMTDERRRQLAEADELFSLKRLSDGIKIHVARLEKTASPAELESDQWKKLKKFAEDSEKFFNELSGKHAVSPSTTLFQAQYTKEN